MNLIALSLLPIHMKTSISPTRCIVAVSFALAAVSGSCAQDTIMGTGQAIGEFAAGSLSGWSERSFDGNTRYELVDDNGLQVLKGHTIKQASVLYRKTTVDLGKTPIVNWSWKVDRTYPNINEKTREGDDFPARLYVVAKVGFLPWETIAINYVWASTTPIGESWPNPYTNKAKMLAIQSGDTDVGKWSTHSRNVAEDFKTLFNQNIDEINGYAVMVDGDNSQMDAIAWFGKIAFSKQ